MAEQLSLQVPAHQNRSLFSDHYLNENLPTLSGWKALRGEATAALAQIGNVLAAYVPSENERQTEDNLVCPILRALGHTFEVQAPLKTSDGTKVPDYVFYRDQASVDAHKNMVLTDRVPQEGAFAVGDAKYWGRPLDIAVKTKGADALSNKNPSYQIYFYMLHSGVEWGLLTNGKLWRLYHRDTAHKLDVYYEVDLPELIESGDVSRFLYFYAFFRRAAFDPGTLGLTELLRASVAYAHGVGTTLKAQVYDALRHIGQGFLDYPGNQLGTDPATMKTIYDSSLILLYRLIFILYAEARELLPVRESELYRDEYSLQAIKNAVARDLGFGKRLLPTSARTWQKLTELFGFIDKGEPPLKIATFNGGLFDPVKHPFLEQYTVGDAHLQLAIDKLARVDGDFIDYRDLAVRHMGTIYEGLLEYRLQPTDGTDVSPVSQTGSVHGRDAHATGAGFVHGPGAEAGSDHGRDAHATGDGFAHGRDGHNTEELPVDKRHGAYLPHWTREGAMYAVNFRLCDSLPQSVAERWIFERKDIVWRAEQANRPLTDEECQRLDTLFSERVEGYLDAGHGECWLQRPEIAQMLRDALMFFHGTRYELVAWCIMPNHVHAIVRPLPPYTLEQIAHSWKSFSAHEANNILQRNGDFWQPESYDHLIRDEEDFQHCLHYLLNNPDRAGLQEWPWCGTGGRDEEKRGTGVSPVCNSSPGTDAGFVHGRDAHATGAGFAHGRRAEAGSDHGRDAHATGAGFAHGRRAEAGSDHGRDAHATGAGSARGRDGHATFTIDIVNDKGERKATGSY